MPLRKPKLFSVDSGFKCQRESVEDSEQGKLQKKVDQRGKLR